MGAFLVYILKSSVCLAAFYLCYRLLLSRETFHRFNRMALLSLLALSCLVPLVEVSVPEASEVNQPFLTQEELLLTAQQDETASAREVRPSAFTWREGLLLTYLLGGVLVWLWKMWSFLSLWRVIRSGRVRQEEYGVWVITHRKEMAPFSWARFIVLSEKDLAEHGREILVHERAHIRACHSLDLLLADVCACLQWFNPAAWLLKRELQTLHEYEADARVLAEGIDARNYQMLLLKKAVGTRLYSMANNLNHSSLKKRFTMMMRRKSHPWARAKYACVLPLAAVAVAAFARPEVSNELSEISSSKVNDLSAMLKADEVKSVPNITVRPSVALDSVYSVVDELPEFPGGMTAALKWLSEHIKYPQAAQEQGHQGRVIVTFVVEKDGRISTLKVAKSPHRELEAEALRVVALMPNWKPGRHKGEVVRTQMMLPIMFRLSGPTKAKKKPTTAFPTELVRQDTVKASNP